LPPKIESPLTLPIDPIAGPRFCLIPTTCATGAEAAAVAVLTESTGAKIPVLSDLFLADCVILDGRFLDNCRRELLADSIGDLLSHSIESFVSIVSSTFADVAAVAALQLALADPAGQHCADRGQTLMEAAYLAGLAASNCSVGIVHAFAHSVARLGVSHGHANALGLIPGVRINRSVPRMAELAARSGLGDVDALIGKLGSALEAATTCCDRKLAACLVNMRRRNEILDAMEADTCLRTNPQRLTRDDLARFLDDVVSGMRVP
jgi:alcohol dehydrogenase class IV